MHPILIPAHPDLLEGWFPPVLIDGTDAAVLVGWADEVEGDDHAPLVYHRECNACREPGDVGAVEVAEVSLDLARADVFGVVLRWVIAQRGFAANERDRTLEMLLRWADGKTTVADCLVLSSVYTVLCEGA